MTKLLSDGHFRMARLTFSCSDDLFFACQLASHRERRKLPDWWQPEVRNPREVNMSLLSEFSCFCSQLFCLLSLSLLLALSLALFLDVLFSRRQTRALALLAQESTVCICCFPKGHPSLSTTTRTTTTRSSLLLV